MNLNLFSTKDINNYHLLAIRLININTLNKITS